MAKFNRHNGGGRRLLREGRYEATIEKAYLGESRAGNEMLTLELRVDGKKIRAWIVTDHWRAANLEEATGCDDSDDLIGRRVGVEISHDEYNGRPTERVEKFFVLDEEKERSARNGYGRRYDAPQSGGEDYDDCPF